MLERIFIWLEKIDYNTCLNFMNIFFKIFIILLILYFSIFNIFNFNLFLNNYLKFHSNFKLKIINNNKIYKNLRVSITVD